MNNAVPMSIVTTQGAIKTGNYTRCSEKDSVAPGIDTTCKIPPREFAIQKALGTIRKYQVALYANPFRQNNWTIRALLQLVHEAAIKTESAEKVMTQDMLSYDVFITVWATSSVQQRIRKQLDKLELQTGLSVGLCVDFINER